MDHSVSAAKDLFQTGHCAEGSIHLVEEVLWGGADARMDLLGMRSPTEPFQVHTTFTGGKGSLTQQAHCEFIVGSETIRPHFTWWVHAGYFLKVPTNSPPKNPPGKG